MSQPTWVLFLNLCIHLWPQFNLLLSTSNTIMHHATKSSQISPINMAMSVVYFSGLHSHQNLNLIKHLWDASNLELKTWKSLSLKCYIWQKQVALLASLRWSMVAVASCYRSTFRSGTKRHLRIEEYSMGPWGNPASNRSVVSPLRTVMTQTIQSRKHRNGFETSLWTSSQSTSTKHLIGDSRSPFNSTVLERIFRMNKTHGSKSRCAKCVQ